MCTSLIPRTLITLVILFFLSGCSITRALRVEDRTIVDVRTMIAEVGDVPVVFVGERHDASEHHKVQLEVLKGLKAQGKSLAIGMEMFEGFSQKALDAWSAGKVPTNAFIKVYQSNWRNVPYWLYEDIFNFSRDNHIPIVALNAPREIVTKVSQQGLSSLSNDDKRLLPPRVDSEVSDSYLDFIRSSYAVHGKNDDHFRHICEAQMLRNRVMASRIRDYHQLHPEKVMVVLAGGGHTRGKGGVPAELGDLPFKIILPPIPGLNVESIRTEDAHFLLEEPFSLFDLL
jgi:uncharacterized iron-regulated protein